MSWNIPYRINPVGVIERVRELSKWYPSLILGFNAYLPNGYEIMLNDEEKTSLKNATNYEEERHFVENIKVTLLLCYDFTNKSRTHYCFNTLVLIWLLTYCKSVLEMTMSTNYT